jgi:hypothetical protein
MSKLQFLSPDEARGLDLPWPDVYFSPHYGLACEASDDAAWELAYWPEGPILYPYLKRPIEPSLAGEGLFDIVSPYGYCGVWAPPATSPQTWREFRTSVREELRERGCVAEFLRMTNLVPGRAELLVGDPNLVGAHVSDTVSLNVSLDYETLWNAAEGRCRTKTRKGRNLGYTWSCRAFEAKDAAPDSLFRTLYRDTMARVNSAPRYFFSDAYFATLQEQLAGRIHQLEVRAGEDVVLAGIFMEWGPLLHLHLVGSHGQAAQNGAGNVAYDGLIQWACRERRFRKLHVGGGMAPNDGMFKFKRSFGGDLEPFWTCRGVFDADRYRQLTRAAAERLNAAPELLEQSGYFPAYRAVIAAEAAAA